MYKELNIISTTFIYIDIKKFNKPVIIIQDLKNKDNDMIKEILKELKKILVLDELIKII